jgi:hypothetical protein
MARPSKLTPHVVKRLIDAVQMCVPYDQAAQYAGIAPSTFYAWKAAGEKATAGRFADFAAELRLAEGKAAMSLLVLVNHAAHEGNWHVAAWLLSRRYPQDWGPRGREQNEDAGTLEIRITRYDGEQWSGRAPRTWSGATSGGSAVVDAADHEPPAAEVPALPPARSREDHEAHALAARIAAAEAELDRLKTTAPTATRRREPEVAQNSTAGWRAAIGVE